MCGEEVSHAFVVMREEGRAAAESIQLEVLVDDEDARLEVVHLAQHQRMVFIELRLQKEKMSKRKDE